MQTVQFLLSCNTLEVFLGWLEALSAAIDLAPALDQRALPRLQTLPRRRRRQTPLPPVIPANATPQEEMEIREQAAIIRRNFPQLEVLFTDQERFGPSPEAARPRAPEPEETLTEDGKWAPRNLMTREANLRYARRCMAALSADAPRQSDYVVIEGKRMRIVWEERKIVADDGVVENTAVVEGGKVEAPTGRPQTGKGKQHSKRWKYKGTDSQGEASKMPRLPEYSEVVAGTVRIGPLGGTVRRTSLAW